MVVIFSTGDTTVLSPIPIVNDDIAENPELFDLLLASSDRAASIPELRTLKFSFMMTLVTVHSE